MSEKRPSVDQEPFATALGTRQEREPWAYAQAIQPTVQLADYSRAPLPTRGLMALIRFQRAASGGASHTFLRLASPYGFCIHQILSLSSVGGGLFMTSGPGAGEASNQPLDVSNGSWWYGVSGTGERFPGPPNFGYASPTNPDALTGDTGYCGQFGGMLVPDAEVLSLGGNGFALWQSNDRPLTFYPAAAAGESTLNAGVTFIARIANQALDLSILFSFPLRRLPTPETF